MAMDRENQLCIKMLEDIEFGRMRPQYVLLEQQQCANSLYCFQACEEGLLNVKTKNGGVNDPKYLKETSFATQFDFNHTTKTPFIKESHLYKI